MKTASDTLHLIVRARLTLRAKEREIELAQRALQGTDEWIALTKLKNDRKLLQYDVQDLLEEADDIFQPRLTLAYAEEANP